MIFLVIVFLINLLISNSRFSQAKYLFIISSLLHISLYLISSEYSVDYENYLRIWDKTEELGNMPIFTEDFLFYQLISILKSLEFSYISLPVTSLLLSCYSIYIFSKEFNKSANLIFSSLTLPFITYLSFHNIRQSLSMTFLILAISLLLSTNCVSYKKYKIIIFSLLSIFTHFTAAIYILTFLIFYFFSDYLVNLKSNINKINLKINKLQFTLFLSSIFFSSSVLFFSRDTFYQYFLKFAWYSSLNSDSKYNASSGILFAIFTFLLALFIIYKFLKSNIWRILSRSEKAIVFLNVLSLIQFILVFIASTISMRISFYSLLISVISIAILRKYAYLNILESRLCVYYINIFYIGLLGFAPTLSVYRSLLPF